MSRLLYIYLFVFMKYILNKMNKYIYLKSFITLMRLDVLLLGIFSLLSLSLIIYLNFYFSNYIVSYSLIII